MLTVAPLAGQQPPPPNPDRLRQERDELERIRRERSDLENRMRELRTTVHGLEDERENLARQADATARLIRSLDNQLRVLADEELSATKKLVSSQDELASKQAVLRHRIREIYKRGALYSLEALLSAQSFGDLVARYKYLHLVTMRDRALVNRFQALGQEIARNRAMLVRLRNDVELSRQDKTDEEKRLRALEARSGQSLAQAQRRQQAVEARLQQIMRDEARLTSLIASIDDARRRAAARGGRGATSMSTLRTSDFGRLDWPVEGTILYPFGRFINPNNTTVRWNGIGIAAPIGASVKVISAGTVVSVAKNGTYGLTVIVDHGGGDYSLYMSLDQAQVVLGARVSKGQVIGTVGRADPDMEPHLHFEIRPHPRQIAVDPLEWLRAHR